VRGSWLGDGLFLDLDAVELTHGESLAPNWALLNIQDAEERQETEQCSADLRRGIMYICGAFILILVVWRSSASLASFGDFTLTMPDRASRAGHGVAV